MNLAEILQMIDTWATELGVYNGPSTSAEIFKSDIENLKSRLSIRHKTRSLRISPTEDLNDLNVEDPLHAMMRGGG